MSIVFEKIKYMLIPTHSGFKVLENVDIVVEDGLIKCIGRNCGKPGNADKVASNKYIVLPGLIDPHVHIGYIALRGLYHGLDSHRLIEKIYELEDKLVDQEFVYRVSRVACTYMLLNGFIGFINMYHYPLETIKACSEQGLYIATGPGYGLKSSYGVKSFIEEFREKDKVIPVFNIYRYSVDGVEELVNTVHALREYDVYVNMQLAMTRREVFLFKKNTGKWPVQYMVENKVLNSKTIIAHLNWVSNMELELLRRASPYTVVVPSTTMYLGERGFAPVYEMLETGLDVLIGSDGYLSSPVSFSSILRDLILLYRYSYGDARLDVDKLVSRGMLSCYRLFGIDNDLVKPGSPANVSVFSIRELLNAGLGNSDLLNGLHRIVNSGLEAEYVLINGRIAVEPGSKSALVERIADDIEWLRRFDEKLVSVDPL